MVELISHVLSPDGSLVAFSTIQVPEPDQGVDWTTRGLNMEIY